MEEIPLKPLVQRLRRLPQHMQAKTNVELWGALGNAVADYLEADNKSHATGREFAQAYHQTLELAERGVIREEQYPGLGNLGNPTINNLFRLAFPGVVQKIIPEKHWEDAREMHLRIIRERMQAVADAQFRKLSEN
ncbi:hypothetical protein HY572_00205 [Candidatus Micrarchaeota archaeon]|nr:hypothetical protein [Candidatus Micrarchaeota archaeon]